MNRGGSITDVLPWVGAMSIVAAAQFFASSVQGERQQLFDRIRTLLDGRTVLFISHRFSSVRSADRIYVLDEGRVVESGSHGQLMAADGLYAELFALQAAAYLDASA